MISQPTSSGQWTVHMTGNTSLYHHHSSMDATTDSFNKSNAAVAAKVCFSFTTHCM